MKEHSLTKEQYKEILLLSQFERAGESIRMFSPQIPLAVECGLFDSEYENKEACFWAFDRLLFVHFTSGHKDWPHGEHEQLVESILSKPVLNNNNG